jgi:D-sedoheptulose 7-phosphate isomerase
VSGEPTSFLYPFIEAEERDASALVANLATSARTKMADSGRLRAATLERCTATIESLAVDIGERLCGGGRLLCFGNGGSATDAEGMVTLFRDPPVGQALPAMSLVADTAILSALANDVGFDLTFSRQIIAYGRAEDIAIGFSTSGSSVNVLRGLEEAAHREMLTVGLSGYDGGEMATSDALGYCLVVRSDSVHRIQEVQAALVLELWMTLQRGMNERLSV